MATTNNEDRRALERLAELACDEARQRGARQARARASLRNRYRVIVRDGQQEEIYAAASRSLAIELYVAGRYSSHETSVLDDEQTLRAFVGRAVEMTRVLMPDPHRQLPDPRYYAGRSDADLGIHDPAHATLTMADRKQRALAAHDAAREAAGEQVLSVGAGAGDSDGLSVMRASNGFAASHRSTAFSTWATVSVKDRSGRRPSDWAEGSARHHARLPDPAGVGREAARRTLATVGSDKIDSLTLPLVIENRALGSLLRGLLAPLAGQALDQKRSCFERSLRQPIASALLDVVDDPLLAGGWGSRRYDGEGLTSRVRPLFDKGVLRTFFIDSYYARKLRREPTSGGTSNLVFTAGSDDVEGLCRRAGRAILITGFLGGNSNSTTGDFSHGINGFLIENGQRTRPISSMNIAGNHTTFWNKLEAVGNDPYPYSAHRTPSLLFSPVVVAGK